MREIFEERARAWGDGGARPESFRGTLLDERAFAIDLEDWGYDDVRREPDDTEGVPVE